MASKKSGGSVFIVILVLIAIAAIGFLTFAQQHH